MRVANKPRASIRSGEHADRPHGVGMEPTHDDSVAVWMRAEHGVRVRVLAAAQTIEVIRRRRKGRDVAHARASVVD
jgi:hypothetical protein